MDDSATEKTRLQLGTCILVKFQLIKYAENISCGHIRVSIYWHVSHQLETYRNILQHTDSMGLKSLWRTHSVDVFRSKHFSVILQGQSESDSQDWKRGPQNGKTLLCDMPSRSDRLRSNPWGGDDGYAKLWGMTLQKLTWHRQEEYFHSQRRGCFVSNVTNFGKVKAIKQVSDSENGFPTSQ